MLDLTNERQAMDKIISSLRSKKEKLDNSTMEARIVGERINLLTNRMLFITQELTHITLYANKISPVKETELQKQTSNLWLSNMIPGIHHGLLHIARLEAM